VASEAALLSVSQVVLLLVSEAALLLVSGIRSRIAFRGLGSRIAVGCWSQSQSQSTVPDAAFCLVSEAALLLVVSKAALLLVSEAGLVVTAPSAALHSACSCPNDPHKYLRLHALSPMPGLSLLLDPPPPHSLCVLLYLLPLAAGCNSNMSRVQLVPVPATRR
jgi:hypothetical protein